MKLFDRFVRETEVWFCERFQFSPRRLCVPQHHCGENTFEDITADTQRSPRWRSEFRSLGERFRLDPVTRHVTPQREPAP